MNYSHGIGYEHPCFPKGTAQHLQGLAQVPALRCSTGNTQNQPGLLLYFYIFVQQCNWDSGPSHLQAVIAPVAADWNRVPTALWDGHHTTPGAARLLCSHTRAAVTKGSLLCWAQSKETKLCTPCTDVHLFFHHPICD